MMHLELPNGYRSILQRAWRKLHGKYLQTTVRADARLELAKQIMEKVLAVLFGLVSPLELPVPEWVTEHE